MPYFLPRRSYEEEYLAITAHVARGNGLWDGRTLTTDNLKEYAIPGSLLSLAAATSAAAPVATPVPPSRHALPGSVWWRYLSRRGGGA